MHMVGIRSLRENPGIISKYASAGELALITNRSKPISLTVPFTDALLTQGVSLNLAIKLFEDENITLLKASKIAGVPVETFIDALSLLGVVAVDYDVDELNAELDVIG
ncbi:MAG: UPF0175 family protein [Saccharospirillaceae bacterium]|nr:UPF0175 family protein [Pseudomonadales bacterium]NRB81621.1 UPF0175 family protein [Saccharospirillaceae bacterium]